MKKGKRIFFLFLTLVMSVGMFSGLATTAFATTEEMALYMYDLPRGGVNKEAWGHGSLSLMGGWTSAAKDSWSVFCKDSYSGQVVYCIEPGVACKTGDVSSIYDESFWDNYPSGMNPTISPTVIKATIGRIMQYGWQGNGNTGRNPDDATGADEIAAQIATQLLVWETVAGERDSQFNHVCGSSQGKNNMIEMVGSNHPLRSQILSHYASIESAVQKHTMLPSFFSRSSAAAGSYELTWNGTNYSATLTDTNQVLSNYRFSSNTSGIEFAVSGNELTISCDTAPTGAVAITAQKTGGSRRGVVVWGDGISGGGNQDFATYGATVDDPVTGRLNLEIMTGAMKLVKTSEDGKVSDIRFTISGEGINTSKTTNASGVIDISDLNPGVYTVTEQLIDKYVPQETRRVTIVSGQTATVNFNNILKRGDLSVTKTSEDGLVSGMKFRLSGTSLSGLAVDEYAVTDENGVAEFTDVLIGSGYTLEEIDTPVRYVIPESQNVAIEWNKVTDKGVNNILKKFQVTLTKSDVETGSSQGDASLAGATYGIYKGNTLIDSYTTDANGQFTSNYYICDYDWNIKEINPSEGYLMDPTIHKVGAEPELYTIELNTTGNDVTEQVIKGNMALIKHTDDGSTQIETPEDGAEFAVFLKASGSYENAKKTERDYLVCDEKGYAVSKNLPYGVYVVRQTKGWDGTEMMPDFEVYIAQDGATYHFIINNAPFASYIKVVKKDVETGNTIPYAGSGFKIYDPQGEIVTMSFTYPTPTTIDTFYTNAEGFLVTPEKLPFGDGYTLVEVAAPYGYVLDATPVCFDVIPENSEDIDSGITAIVVEKPNIAQKGTITVNKSGEVFSTVVSSEDIYQPVYAVAGLPDAVYEITALEDIYTLDGTLRASAGEVVDTITTDANGIATSQLLYLGKYAVKEITAPFGMTINDEAHSVELVYAGQEVEVTTTDTSFYNERQKVKIYLVKTLEKDEKFQVGFGNEILDVAFGIYARAELVAADGTVIPENGLIEMTSVNAEGTAAFATDLPLGSYYVKEIATNKAYILNDTEYDVVFEYAGQETAIVKLAANDGAAIENTLIRGDIKGIKVDENDLPLSGAVIGLFKFDETTFTDQTAILTTESVDDGSFSFVDVPFGDYIVREIQAPTGYVLSDTNFVVSITGTDSDETELSFAIVNRAIHGNVALTKVDKDYPDNKLTGAAFEVYEDSNGDKKLDKNDKLIGSMTELTGGVYQMDNLIYGGYFVKEKTAPIGFILDENAYYFEIIEDGKTVVVENEAGKGFINAAQLGSLKIVKSSSDGKLEGFSFRITGANGYNKTFITDKDGVILVEGLRIGEYIVSEISNEANAAYILPVDKEATVKVEATTIVQMRNELKPIIPDIPKTGDTTNPLMWMIICAVSLAGAGAATFFGFRKDKKNEEE